MKITITRNGQGAADTITSVAPDDRNAFWRTLPNGTSFLMDAAAVMGHLSFYAQRASYRIRVAPASMEEMQDALRAATELGVLTAA